MISRWVIVLAFAASLLSIGCGKANPMVGTWKLVSAKKVMPPGAKPLVVTAEFKSDNTYSLSDNLFGKKNTIEGTYKVEKKIVTLTLTKANGNPQGPSTPITITLSNDGKSFELPGSPDYGKMVKE